MQDGSGDDRRRTSKRFDHWIDYAIVAIVLGLAVIGYLLFRSR
jgi:hypothetical protein